MKISDVFANRKNEKFGNIQPPYIIAEAGVNHEGSLDTAKLQIEQAADSGCHAIKFQTYKAEKIASKDSPYYWDLNEEPTESQFQLFKKYDKFWKKEYEALKVHCDKNNIEFLSTPFDTESFDFLIDLMPAVKVSSSDLNNLPFIEYMCKNGGKPIILSTGASYLWEVKRTIELIDSYELDTCLMHCVLNYPTPDEHANLGMLLDLKRHFPHSILGYSDHTLPKEMETLLTSYTMGAQIIEKHFTHDKSLKGNDHYHSMDVDDMFVFNKKLDALISKLGRFNKTVLPSEEKSRANARRSLIANVDIEEGTVIKMEHLTWKRPAAGISPENIEELIGRKASRNIENDTVLQWEMFQKN
jgi:N-acetylneuraminate synthase